MVALARAGFTACAFDNLSDRPAADAAYQPASLIEDVRTAIAASGHERAAVAGQDWGGFVAWRAATSMPAMVTRLVTLNMPHPDLWPAAMQGTRRPAYLGTFSRSD